MDTFENALKETLRIGGREILREKYRLTAYLADLAPDQKREVRIFQKLCEKLIQESDWLDESGREFRDVLCRYYNDSELEIPFAEICKYTDYMLDSKHFLKICGIEKVSRQWEAQAKAYIASCADLTDAELRELILLCLNIQSKDSEIVKKMYFQYYSGAYRMEGEKENG